MRVKHKDAKKEHMNMSMSLEHWHKAYLPNKKYLNYEFYDVGEIFDLHEIDPETGNTIYIKSEFLHGIAHFPRENPNKYVIKDHDDSRLDEYLMPKKRGVLTSQPLSPLLKMVKYIIPTIKLDTQRKRHITIVVLMVLTIVAMFIIAYYQGIFN